MKRFLLIALIFSLCHPVFAQNIPTIKASEAGSYVGKLVFLKDSIRSGIIVTDSVAVLKVGGKLDKDAVSVIYLKKQHTVDNLDRRFITTLQHARAEFRGIVIPATSGFIIIIDGADKGRNIILNGPFPE